ncbi:MAG: hypothetical protein KAS21_09730 [Candidatus Aminicenantes bacterium]|nr:hypothetical protein [Candidatus Aminicenantes bacterium]
MNITSIFRFNGIDKRAKAANSNISKINNFLKNKIGVGVGFIFAIVIIYLIVTLFSIYNLLVSL